MHVKPKRKFPLSHRKLGMSSWGEQYSAGDQSISSRSEFRSSSYAKCPSCGSCEIGMTHDVAGCRHNGDGYGTDEYWCKQCSWRTSFQWDEAGDSYYYESLQPPKKVVRSTSPQLIEEDFKKNMKQMLKLKIPQQAVANMMTIKGYNNATTAKFFEEWEKSSQP